MYLELLGRQRELNDIESCLDPGRHPSGFMVTAERGSLRSIIPVPGVHGQKDIVQSQSPRVGFHGDEGLSMCSSLGFLVSHHLSTGMNTQSREPGSCR